MLYKIIFSILLHARENNQTERINEVKHFLAANGFEFWTATITLTNTLKCAMATIAAAAKSPRKFPWRVIYSRHELLRQLLTFSPFFFSVLFHLPFLQQLGIICEHPLRQ